MERIKTNDNIISERNPSCLQELNFNMGITNQNIIHQIIEKKYENMGPRHSLVVTIQDLSKYYFGIINEVNQRR